MKLGRNASTLDTQQFNPDQSTLKLKARVLKQVIKIIIKLEKKKEKPDNRRNLEKMMEYIAL